MQVFLLISFLLLNITVPLEAQRKRFIFNVVDNGDIDDTQAFNDAWKATCESSLRLATMLIPYGKTFLLQPLLFKGPCKAKNVRVQINGNITAPRHRRDWHCFKNSENQCKHLLGFVEVDNLFIEGTGTINGQGSDWWDCKHTKFDKHKSCPKQPTVLLIQNCNNVSLKNFHIVNSPQEHIGLERSTRVLVSHLTILAPDDSPNTDGIHIQRSQNVAINNSIIGTGDDCISMGDESMHINISRIACGPGHGISVGSLGKGGSEVKVEYIHVRDVVFTGTSNGARIKTWQGGRGYARNIVFEGIQCNDVANPIVIDQYYYCAKSHKCENQTSAVHISNVTFSQFHGTSRKLTAVNLGCSQAVPCNNILMNHINMTRTGGRPTFSYCWNAHGRYYGEMKPMVPCLQPLQENFQTRTF